jgi:hypothetical protein
LFSWCAQWRKNAPVELARKLLKTSVFPFHMALPGTPRVSPEIKWGEVSVLPRSGSLAAPVARSSPHPSLVQSVAIHAWKSARSCMRNPERIRSCTVSRYLGCILTSKLVSHLHNVSIPVSAGPSACVFVFLPRRARRSFFSIISLCGANHTLRMRSFLLVRRATEMRAPETANKITDLHLITRAPLSYSRSPFWIYCLFACKWYLYSLIPYWLWV